MSHTDADAAASEPLSLPTLVPAQAVAPPAVSDSSRREFSMASQQGRKLSKQQVHQAQLAKQLARKRQLNLEALAWCRECLQVDEAVTGIRASGAIREQRCNLLLQSTGTAYKGMQIQNRTQTPTIENALLHALYRAGAIDPSPDVTLQQLRWMRCARTDAGVHAAFNVVSCILQVHDGLVARVNSFLPRDICLLDILPVADFEAVVEGPAAPPPSGSPDVSSEGAAQTAPIPPFHTRESCTGRSYEYIMPAALWTEARTGADAAAPPSTSVSNGTAAAPAIHSSKAPSYLPLFAEPVPASPPSFDAALFQSARVSDGDVARVNRILARFEGVGLSYHNFGRFDPNMLAAAAAAAAATADPSASASVSAPITAALSSSSTPVVDSDSDFLRTVSRCSISDVFLHGDVQYTRVIIEGKSFMMHQIRKMMALAVMVARGRCCEDIFDSVFDASKLYDIPVAPARGLLLRRPHFAGYDAACDARGLSACSISRAYESLQPDHSDFARHVIEGEVCDVKASHSAYRAWLLATHQQALMQARKRAQAQTAGGL